MTHIKQLARADLPELEPVMGMVEQAMGFVPNSFLTMAHWPEMLHSFSTMAGTILNSGEVDGGLKQLIAYVTSNAAGCRYCQAHTSHNAEKKGIAAEKVAHAFEFEQSDLFSLAERAALRVALYGGTTPNGVEAEHMATLQAYFTDKQIVEIVGVISLFGFLNRWNDTMATTLETAPSAAASELLINTDWQPGKHKP
jgi:uncharacterized peroxidase-related enzyme